MPFPSEHCDYLVPLFLTVVILVLGSSWSIPLTGALYLTNVVFVSRFQFDKIFLQSSLQRIALMCDVSTIDRRVSGTMRVGFWYHADCISHMWLVGHNWHVKWLMGYSCHVKWLVGYNWVVKWLVGHNRHVIWLLGHNCHAKWLVGHNRHVE